MQKSHMNEYLLLCNLLESCTFEPFISSQIMLSDKKKKKTQKWPAGGSRYMVIGVK